MKHTHRMTRVWLAATILAACGPAPRHPTAASPGAVSIDDVIDGKVALGTTVTVRGTVLPLGGGCLDVVCTTPSGCCGTCSADAVLSPTGVIDGERFLWLSPAAPSNAPDAFGRCHDSDVCALTCTPTVGGVISVTGEVVDAGSWRGLRVHATSP